MLTIACPLALVSLPFIRLCPKRANPEGARLAASIETTATGREALDKLNGKADFALASKSAFRRLPEGQRKDLIEIGEIISHNVCSIIHSKVFPINEISDLFFFLKPTKKKRHGLFVVQEQTNYYDIAHAFVSSELTNCAIMGLPYDELEVDQSDVGEILKKDSDFLIWLGLPRWLDDVEEVVRSHQSFKAVYKEGKRFNRGFNTEQYSLYASIDAVQGDKRQNLEDLRKIIMYLNEFNSDTSRIVAKTSYYIKEDYRNVLPQIGPTGDLEKYCRDIVLLMETKLTARVAEIWEDEVSELSR